MNKIKRCLLALAMLTAAAAPMHAERLVILSANDTHSQILPRKNGMGGWLRHRAIYDQVRAQNKNVVTLHCGDAVQGTNYFSRFGGQVEFPMLDSLRYDMVTFGNHEFDNGIDSLATFYNRLSTKIVSTNYDLSATKIANVVPWVMKTYGDRRVAFIATNVNPVGMVAEGRYDGLRFTDPLKVADATAHYLKTVQGADYVVMFSHIGYSSMVPTEANDSLLVAQSHDIDLVIGGHSHTLVKPGSPMSMVANADGRTIIVGQNGKSGEWVGRYDLDLETGEVHYNHIAVDSQWDAAAASYTALNQWVDTFTLELVELENTVIGRSAQEMPQDSPQLVNWVCDAVVECVNRLSPESKIQGAIMNKGGIRCAMPQGDVTQGLVESMMPFDNHLTVLELTGQQLLDALEVMTYRGGDAVSKEFDVVYKGNEIVSAKLGGKAIKPSQSYRIATIDFLATGGDYMVSFKQGKRLWTDDKKYVVHILDHINRLTAAGKPIAGSSKSRMREKK